MNDPNLLIVQICYEPFEDYIPSNQEIIQRHQEIHMNAGITSIHEIAALSLCLTPQILNEKTIQCENSETNKKIQNSQVQGQGRLMQDKIM